VKLYVTLSPDGEAAVTRCMEPVSPADMLHTISASLWHKRASKYTHN